MLGRDPAGVADICAALTRAGYECLPFADPLRALARLGDGDVSLLVADRSLPLLDGEQVVVAARARGRALPAILLGREEGVAAPAGVERLPQPVDPRALVALVRRHLGASTRPTPQG